MRMLDPPRPQSWMTSPLIVSKPSYRFRPTMIMLVTPAHVMLDDTPIWRSS